MAYTKVDWTEETPISETNLDNMETIYDELIADAEGAMANENLEMLAQIVDTKPVSPSIGAVLYDKETGQFWVAYEKDLGGGSTVMDYKQISDSGVQEV